MNSEKILHTSFPKRSFPLFWLLFIALLNIALRINSIGHALTWDEAWILCAIKSLAEGVDTGFQNQLWRHPPVYLGFGLLLAPLKEGFDMRMQMLSLGLSTVALLVFVTLVSYLFGRRLGLLTALVYTLLPGTMLFDTWIKRDALVTLFCSMALFAFYKRKNILAGIFLGLGFLSKETALFFAVTLMILIILHTPPKNIFKTFLVVFVPTVIVSGWWYVFFHQGLSGYTNFFHGISEEAAEFSKPWWYYFTKLQYDIGYSGILLFAFGILALLLREKNNGHTRQLLQKLPRRRLLPLFVLLPAYIILSVSHGKPPWITISLYPFFALIIAVGWTLLLKLCLKMAGKSFLPMRAGVSWLVSVFIILSLAHNVLPFNHIAQLQKMSPSTVSTMRTSYEMAEAVNQLTAEKERLLLLPMIYRIGPTMPDPIFYWHVKPLQIFKNNNIHIRYDEFKYLVIRNSITWALLFPIDGSNQLDIYEQSVRDIKSWGYKITNGVLLRVDSYWQDREGNN
ncbi:MAG: hypothetical protein AMK70_09745 [Nitrospira bacterium SG8_35_1]|nr:MAG: hypothetical protein AMK70_09745 [Nitrospira bacterium SG8_35_1]